jgi:sugar/nucleoside kinase (ribokinase family)
MKVLCTGNMVYDILVRPVIQPAHAAGTTIVESIEQSVGGNGANSAYTLGKLGIPVRLLSMAGTDTFGEFVLGQLRSAGVDVSGVRRSLAPTSATVVLVNGAGDRSFLHRLGSSAEVHISADEFERELADGVSHYHLATPFTLLRMRPYWPDLLRRAKARGVQTSLDTQWDSKGRWLDDLAPCLSDVDVLFTNEDEAAMLARSSEPREIARVLRGSGAHTIVVKLGARGCVVFTADDEIRISGFTVPVVDTTGAGDCFAGGYVAALARGASHADAARFANAVGALVVQRLGGVAGVRSWEETLQWMETAG